MSHKTENDFRKEFLDVVKYFNEVVMSNPIVMDIRAIMKYKALIDEYTSETGILLHNSNNGVNIPGYKKNDFFVYLMKKNDDIQEVLASYLGKLNFYYTKYKKNYDNITLLNVVMSSGLTFIEALSLTLDQQVPFSIVSITISTGLAISTSYLKIKNYKEKLENIVKAQEKIQTCQAKLFTFDKKLKSHLCLTTTPVINSVQIVQHEHSNPSWSPGSGDEYRSDELSGGEPHEPFSHS